MPPVLKLLIPLLLLSACSDSNSSPALAEIPEDYPFVADAFSRFSKDANLRQTRKGDLRAYGIDGHRYDCFLVFPSEAAAEAVPHGSPDFVYCYEAATGEFAFRL